MQIRDLIEFLRPLQKGRLVSELQSGTSASHDVAYAHPEGVRCLTCPRYLTLMDSTHKTNDLKCYLTTLMVRDEQMSWIPAVFFLHDGSSWSEDVQDEAIREWIGSLEKLTGTVGQQGVDQLKDLLSASSLGALENSYQDPRIRARLGLECHFWFGLLLLTIGYFTRSNTAKSFFLKVISGDYCYG